MKTPELPGKGHVFSALPITLRPILGGSEAEGETGPQVMGSVQAPSGSQDALSRQLFLQCLSSAL